MASPMATPGGISYFDEEVSAVRVRPGVLETIENIRVSITEHRIGHYVFMLRSGHHVRFQGSISHEWDLHSNDTFRWVIRESGWAADMWTLTFASESSHARFRAVMAYCRRPLAEIAASDFTAEDWDVIDLDEIDLDEINVEDNDGPNISSLEDEWITSFGRTRDGGRTTARVTAKASAVTSLCCRGWCTRYGGEGRAIVGSRLTHPPHLSHARRVCIAVGACGTVARAPGRGRCNHRVRRGHCTLALSASIAVDGEGTSSGWMRSSRSSRPSYAVDSDFCYADAIERVCDPRPRSPGALRDERPARAVRIRRERQQNDVDGRGVGQNQNQNPSGAVDAFYPMTLAWLSFEREPTASIRKCRSGMTESAHLRRRAVDGAKRCYSDTE
ncbi:hypothetical protein CONPUDRAFT_156837 [Coniophora puteana RWD-64-598 SS2]|uniref:Uncharacterized protein n=1 Tax=Coniophora puteana (strain RWD-64-598) TaxID=741705 RepID=A0A5M3MF25_CONPW|nr:uncharacterized protein CONPUDRAFT_156837 [Coniophora puteana RWD-64-598 SS2]EIW77637.1 hypothetical protein CONPUDRAFT_156837 [Coniophora puteana RWD-64-598 SS2]